MEQGEGSDGQNNVQTVDYRDALSKCLLFLEAQRSGKLPVENRVPWRSHSGLLDGQDVGIDLTGGYYDAGDNVKFVFPMAFSMTMLSWGVVEYREKFEKCGELENAKKAIRWGTDFLIKAHPTACELYAVVGDGESDHACWMRPEDMTTDRSADKVDADRPGSDVAGEVAAAMAAASIVFRSTDSDYADILIRHAKELFVFADSFRGCYSDSIPRVRPFYKSWNGYLDELLWAAVWLYRATQDFSYMLYLTGPHAEEYGGITQDKTEFSWDDKLAGVQVLMARAYLTGEHGGADLAVLKKYKERADNFIQAQLNGKVEWTPGRLLYVRDSLPIQYAVNAAFLAAVYGDTLKETELESCACEAFRPFSCKPLRPFDIIQMAHTQVAYVLGNNPRRSSYMVGVGRNWPQRVHHRGSSLPPFYEDAKKYGGSKGFQFLHSTGSNPNPALGAIMGGPDRSDNYENSRGNYNQSEPTTYINAVFAGLLARFARTRFEASWGELSDESSSFSDGEGSACAGDASSEGSWQTPLASPAGVAMDSSESSSVSQRRSSSGACHPPPSPPSSRRRLLDHASDDDDNASESSFPFVTYSISTESEWVEDGKRLGVITVLVTNTTARAIEKLMIKPVGFVPKQFWCIERADGGLLKFPPWKSVLQPGEEFKFGLIQPTDPPLQLLTKSYQIVQD